VKNLKIQNVRDFSAHSKWQKKGFLDSPYLVILYKKINFSDDYAKEVDLVINNLHVECRNCLLDLWQGC